MELNPVEKYFFIDGPVVHCKIIFRPEEAVELIISATGATETEAFKNASLKGLKYKNIGLVPQGHWVVRYNGDLVCHHQNMGQALSMSVTYFRSLNFSPEKLAIYQLNKTGMYEVPHEHIYAEISGVATNP